LGLLIRLARVTSRFSKKAWKESAV
jgi:hypothetical protein